MTDVTQDHPLRSLLHPGSPKPEWVTTTSRDSLLVLTAAIAPTSRSKHSSAVSSAACAGIVDRRGDPTEGASSGSVVMHAPIRLLPCA
ncbi:MAG: hypothetical protein HZY73_12370 [Micropruina sp.]|nr:MAG: hypothetical protein HZY73_12370 [Micropruina sp.]